MIRLKKITKYICEICLKEYYLPQDAQNCQSQGYGQAIGEIEERIDILEGYLENDSDFPIYRPCVITNVRIIDHNVVYTLSEIDNEGKVWNGSCTFEINQEEYIRDSNKFKH